MAIEWIESNSIDPFLSEQCIVLSHLSSRFTFSLHELKFSVLFSNTCDTLFFYICICGYVNYDKACLKLILKLLFNY